MFGAGVLSQSQLITTPTLSDVTFNLPLTMAGVDDFELSELHPTAASTNAIAITTAIFVDADIRMTIPSCSWTSIAERVEFGLQGRQFGPIAYGSAAEFGDLANQLAPAQKRGEVVRFGGRERLTSGV